MKQFLLNYSKHTRTKYHFFCSYTAMLTFTSMQSSSGNHLLQWSVNLVLQWHPCWCGERVLRLIHQEEQVQRSGLVADAGWGLLLAYL